MNSCGFLFKNKKDMKEQINNAVDWLKEQPVKGCITGSCLLEYFEGQDVDCFLYDEKSFNELCFAMHHSALFTQTVPLEKWKWDQYRTRNNSTFYKFGLITIKFTYNTCVEVNVILKKEARDVFAVMSSFDLDIICKGYDIQTKKYLDLSKRETVAGSEFDFKKGFRAAVKEYKNQSQDNWVSVEDRLPNKDCDVCGGEGWLYDEELHKTRKRVTTPPTWQAGIEQQVDFAILNIPYVIYYFKDYVNPTELDRIIEVDSDSDGNPVRPIVKRDIFNITLAEPFRDLNGRIEYWRCAVKKEELRYGRTL